MAEINCEDLKLPHSPFPRPGERVVWYSGNAPKKGTLIGYEVGPKPRVLTDFGNQTTIPNFSQLRIENPFDRVAPNWCKMPAHGKIYKATKDQANHLGSILQTRIPPGPSYMELIHEIYYRGFEVYLVGGTVRDIIQGDKSHDVDIVTSMPLDYALPLIRGMFRNVSPQKPRGYLRIGGSPTKGEAFIDVKNFALYNPGAYDVLFGSDLERDVSFRDFACNSIYYDPMNEVFLDPCGRGYEDAVNRRLHIVTDCSISTGRVQQAKIFIRFIKFVCGGYHYEDPTLDRIKVDFASQLCTMDFITSIGYVQAQILNKYPKAVHKDRFDNFYQKVQELDFDPTIISHIGKLENEILL